MWIRSAVLVKCIATFWTPSGGDMSATGSTHHHQTSTSMFYCTPCVCVLIVFLRGSGGSIVLKNPSLKVGS